MFVSILLGLVFIVLSLSVKNTGKDSHLALAYFGFKTVYWLILIVITIVGFYVTNHFPSKQKPFTGFQMLLILSSFGFYIFYFFSMPAAIAVLLGSHKHGVTDSPNTTKAILLILDSTLNAVQIYYQVPLLFHAISIDPGSVRETHCKSYRAFKQVLLFLGTANLFIWCVDSFFEVSYLDKTSPVQVAYYTKPTWEVITHISYPITLFFRFNSFISILMTYFTI